MIKILVIADDPDNRSQYIDLLKSGGYSAHSEELSGPENILDTVKDKNLDLIIIDFGRMSMGVLRELRKEYAALPCVVVVEDEGTLFLNHLSTPRIQYLSDKSRFTKLLEAVKYGLEGKSTIERMKETE